jgi:2-polyprenyl-3-methyl-5-hydroxy-6-metoxy-1,4-benzoquinol methylase
MRCPSCLSKVVTEKQDYIGKSKVFQEKKLFECSSCQLVFALPAPTSAELTHYYNTYWDGEFATVSPSTEQYYLAQSISRIRYIKQYVNIEKNSHVLDVGAGAGTMADALKKEGVECHYNAVEPDNTQRNQLVKKHNFFYAYREVDEISNKKKFDFIVLSHVLEHVTDPHNFIEKLISFLNPNGSLFIEVPNQDYKYKNIIEPHLLFFNQKSLLKCIESHGKIVNIISVGKKIGKIKLSTDHPTKYWGITFIKELIKAFTRKLDNHYTNKQISKYQMSDYGRNRQWLRAIIRKY